MKYFLTFLFFVSISAQATILEFSPLDKEKTVKIEGQIIRPVYEDYCWEEWDSSCSDPGDMTTCSSVKIQKCREDFVRNDQPLLVEGNIKFQVKTAAKTEIPSSFKINISLPSAIRVDSGDLTVRSVLINGKDHSDDIRVIVQRNINIQKIDHKRIISGEIIMIILSKSELNEALTFDASIISSGKTKKLKIVLSDVLNNFPFWLDYSIFRTNIFGTIKNYVYKRVNFQLSPENKTLEFNLPDFEIKPKVKYNIRLGLDLELINGNTVSAKSGRALDLL